MSPLALSPDEKSDYDSLALENFQEYLRIPSVHPNVNYDACVTFLEKQASSLDLPMAVYVTVPLKPTVIMTWEGQDPNLPSILLNSHMDVVPVDMNSWTRDPFAAEIIDGRIYARGAQDMKNVAIQYLEAIRRLKESGVRLQRTVHLSYVADEEIGGTKGMGAFVQTKDFANLNIGFSLDEGLASPDANFVVFNGERCMWNLIFHCPGSSGHGSQLSPNTAGEKVRVLVDRIYDFRKQERARIGSAGLTIGDVTSMNVTMLNGGVQFNVLPTELCLFMDCRISITTNLKAFEDMLNGWCKDAGQDVWIEKKHFDTIVKPTKLNQANPYWLAMKEVMDKLNYVLKPGICSGITDSRFIRKLGIPALGFSPMNNTPMLLHSNDEYIETNVFLNGIEIYCELIPALANVE